MTLDALAVINKTLSKYNYSFMRYYGDFNKMFWVGEAYKNSGSLEDGSSNSTLILTGTTVNDWMALLKQGEEIEKLLDGMKTQTPTSAIAVYSNGGNPIPSDDERVKRYELTFTINEFKKGI